MRCVKMGTRSTTKIYEDGKLLLALYKQYDGYPDGWGNELKEFLKSGKFVNGLNPSKGKILFNGVGCFALQLVTTFKIGAGDLYATTEDDEQGYNYKIEVFHNQKTYKYEKVVISCKEEPSYKEVIDLSKSGE